jgi:AcrR family transcriptional regulator
LQPNPATLDPRIRRTRQMLANALQELLLEKSFEDISVQDLADRSTVNRATFYDHFADKYALLEATISDRFQCEFSRRMGEAKATCPEVQKQVILTVCAFLSEVSNGCQKHQRQFQPLLETEVKKIVREFLLVGLRELKLAPADAELRATLASWAIFGAALEWSRHQTTTPERLADTILPLIRPALETPPGG